ncbi:hypothetical protein NDU88_002068 [Pleurodeles waltl]|uniref:Uncharacterized protein n=1 Tax=Pleurodeles waltl TaxID=8319 RepID=A0AAV7VD97_PLEWA|nr:hypothetical protein NDU88_002068 [Pleurodeles waltl]
MRGYPAALLHPTPQRVSHRSLPLHHSNWPVPLVRPAAGQCFPPGPGSPGTSLRLAPTFLRVCTASSLTASEGLCRQLLSPSLLRASSAPSTRTPAPHRPGPPAPQQRRQPGLLPQLVVAASMGASRYAPAIPFSSAAVEPPPGGHSTHRCCFARGLLSPRGRLV